MTENTTTETPRPDTNERPVKILVLQRGWVAIGRHAKDGAEHVLTDASIIRRWGTTKGVGQLATDGPRSNTVLDPTGTVRAHELATVLVIDADAAVWADRL